MVFRLSLCIYLAFAIIIPFSYGCDVAILEVSDRCSMEVLTESIMCEMLDMQSYKYGLLQNDISIQLDDMQ